MSKSRKALAMIERKDKSKEISFQQTIPVTIMKWY